MAIANFIPSLWSANILRAFEKAVVYAGRVNRRWEGELTGPGDRVRIPSANNVAVRDYVAGSTTLTYDAPDGTYQDLVIDHAKYWGLSIDDVHRHQAKPELLEESVRLAGVALAEAADTYVRDLMVAGPGVTANLGTSTTPLEIDSKAVSGLFALIAEGLDKENVPRAGRWAIIPPWLAKKVTLSQIALDTSNSGVLSNGYVGRLLGFNLFMSPNVKNTTGAKWAILAGTDDAVTFADQIVKTEALRPATSFADAVRGLHVYGAKVVAPKALALAYCNEKAEA